tara:strand:- start:441 stop:632 length:192 start_codon:yes stop_codon:yes gene_type:complete
MKTETSPIMQKDTQTKRTCDAFCCTSFHAFEECLPEVVTQEVERFSAVEDVSIEKSKRTLKYF